MPPTNDFLEIATAGGANVQTQVDYAADPDRTAFFADGASPDADQHGKMFRQQSVIAHMIAQAICDITALDMLDDGNAATQLARFKSMLALSGTRNVLTAAGTANALTIAPTAAPVAYKDGETWMITLASTNTGAATLNRNAIGAKSIVHPDLSALEYGDMVSAGLAFVTYQLSADKFILLSSTVRPTSTYGEVIGAGSGNITIPTNARQCVIEFCGPGGGGGTGDGGAGAPSGTGQNGGLAGDTTVNGVVAKGGKGGVAGLATGNTYGGDGGDGGGGTGSSYKGQGGCPGMWSPIAGTAGNIGGTGGSSLFGGGGTYINAGAQSGGYGGGGAGGKTGNSGSYSGGAGGGGESRRIVIGQAALVALAGNIAYSIGAVGTAGVTGGDFPGAPGGPGYIRYRFDF